MPEIYDNKINRNTDWGGDASTGFLPVKGSRVQEFIKNELNEKIGAVYKPEGGTFVYYFASEDDKAAFIETGDESLIKDTIEMVSSYDVKLRTDDIVYTHSVIEGATGNTVDFGFKIIDEDGITADARAKIEYEINAGGVVNGFTTEIPVIAGDWTNVSSNIDNYIRRGQNIVSVTITGISTRATKKVTFYYNIFDLSFVPSFPYNEVQTGNTISVPYIIECSETKYLEFFIDGVQVSSLESMVITDIRMDSRATLDISRLAPGQHSLQVRAYVKPSNGTEFYTQSHFYTFAKAGEAPTSFLMYMPVDNDTPITGEGEQFSINVSQFEQITFDWAVYDTLGRRLVIYFEYDGTIVSSSEVDENGDIHTFSYRPMNDGDGKQLRIYSLGEEEEILFDYSIEVNVAETSSGIKEATDGLLLKLQSNGRRNTDPDRDVWQCVGTDGNLYSAEFSGFSWNSQQGWDAETESLVISNGAVVNFNIKPMESDWVLYGGAIEIDLETFDIENDDAVICECANNLGTDEAFFRVTATKAEFSTANHVAINTRYKDNERLKIAFIGNRASDSDDGYLIYIVVNGVLERAALYKPGDSMYSFANLSIGDPTGMCKVRLRSIRVYNKAISVEQAFNNFVVDSDDVQEIYERNNVLKAGSATEVGFEEVANKLPVMIFTGDMDDLVTNGQDKEWRNFDVEYINRQEPERNFVSFNCRMKLQGTSSLGYPRKNFKLNTKDKNFSAEIYNASRYELDPTSVVGNLKLRNKITKEPIDFDDFKTNGRLNNSYCFTLDYSGAPLKKGKYKFRKDAHKAQKWTLKADFMESSCSHNVAAGRSWNDIFENTELLSNGDASYVNNTYRDSALVSRAEYIEYNGYNFEGEPAHYKIENNTENIKRQKKYVCRTDAQKQCIAAGQDDIRTAVDGFPMVCFYRTSHEANDLVFIGQYNFINDKGSYEVFGFEDIEAPDDEETMIYDASKVEVWEGLKNTNPLSLFKTIDGFYDYLYDETGRQTIQKWAETYGARYPDADDYPDYRPDALYELSKWIVSTRHVSGETQYSGTINIDSSFAERINGYQYGYTEDTADSYRYASGTNLEDNAENRQKKFETEKWEHFDVWKLAGYYIYLRRYGAVDQFVKNTMLFTDGNGKYDPRTDIKYRKWFFINYDNDCLFGLRNNGQLAFDWTLDRQTIDSASDVIIDDQADDEGAGVNAYAMMGHDSTLWNNLEADDEFMRMVRDLDYSMTKYKLNYDNMVKEFDTDQTERWCERIYNANERYKYINAAKGIGDMAGRPVNNLWMLQGTRRSHRHWWIANHFNLLDAQWLSGDYKNTYVEIKTSCLAGTAARCKAGAKFYYAWGQQKKIYESNMRRAEGEDIIFAFPTDQSQGDPVYIYAFNKMSEMDFSEMASLVYEGSFKFVLGNTNVQNTMKKLIIGNPNVRNLTSQDTTTWSMIPNLEYLDITNFEGITSVPLESFRNLHTFKASGSKLGAFEPAEGSVFELVELPGSVKTMTLKDISFKHNVFSDLVYTPNTNLDNLTISNNDGVGPEYYNKIILPWINSIEASAQATLLYQNKSINIKNIKWSFGNLNAIKIFKNFSSKGRRFQMSGTIDLRSCGNLSMENINEIKEIFGENCFNPRLSSLYIITPDSVFIKSDRTSMVAGESNTFERIIYPDETAVLENLSEITYYIVEETTMSKSEAEGRIIFEDPIAEKNYLVIEDLTLVRNGITLTNTVDSTGKQIAILRCDETVVGSDVTFKVLVYMGMTSSAIDKVSVMDFTIKDPTYARTAVINGNKSLYRNKEYKFTLSPYTEEGIPPIGSYSVAWFIDEETPSTYVASSHVDPNDKHVFVVTMSGDQPEISHPMTIRARITNHDEYIVTTRFNVLALNESVILTEDSNPVVMEVCFREGWAQDEHAMKKEEAEAVLSIGTAFSNINTSYSFLEFAYFTGVNEIPDSAFSSSRITEIAIPDNVTRVGKYAFSNCSSLSNVCVKEEDITGEVNFPKILPNTIAAIEEGTFLGCSSLRDLTLPDSVRSIENYAFGGTGFRYVKLSSAEAGDGVLRLSNTLETTAPYSFESEKWSPSTTNNRLRRFEIPASLTLSSTFEELLGRDYESFYVEEGHIKYIVTEDGVLMSSDGATILRYPPRKPEQVEEYSTGVVRLIRRYAFFAVKTLDRVLAPSVEAIQIGAFMESDIEQADLSTCNNLQTLPESAFAECRKLKHVFLPTAGSLKTIGVRAFSRCILLEEINIPDGVEVFAKDANGYSYTFVGCNELEEVIFPDSVTGMGCYTVLECANVKKVVLPGYLKYTDGYEQGTNAGVWLVSNCGSLSSLTIPAFSYTVIEDEIPKSIVLNEYIFDKTWWWNPGWKQMNGFALIEGMGNVEELNISSVDDGENYRSINGCIYNTAGNDLKRVPWGATSIEFAEGVDTISSYACDNTKLTRLELPDTVRTIGSFAFGYNAQLTELRLNEGLVSIGDYAFQYINERILIIPNSLMSMGQHVFRFNRNLKRVEMKDYAGSIERFAFNGCYALEEIVVSSPTAPFLANIFDYGVDNLGWYQFNGAGSSASKKELLVSVGSTEDYLVNYENTQERASWTYLFSIQGYTIKEQIVLSGYSHVTIYENGTPYSAPVYAVSSLGHLTGLDGAPYISTCTDGKYLFDLEGVYDNETITIYADIDLTNEIGSFNARMRETEYTVGEPSFGLGGRGKLFASANPTVLAAAEPNRVPEELAEITKSEYDELVARVNQMTMIITKLLK